MESHQICSVIQDPVSLCRKMSTIVVAPIVIFGRYIIKQIYNTL